jgi:hypothetical protein
VAGGSLLAEANLPPTSTKTLSGHLPSLPRRMLRCRRRARSPCTTSSESRPWRGRLRPIWRVCSPGRRDCFCPRADPGPDDRDGDEGVAGLRLRTGLGPGRLLGRQRDREVWERLAAKAIVPSGRLWWLLSARTSRLPTARQVAGTAALRRSRRPSRDGRFPNRACRGAGWRLAISPAALAARRRKVWRAATKHSPAHRRNQGWLGRIQNPDFAYV